ncbi:MAG: multidrug ABC transporter permease [Robiginitomaculum sp.]|nr:MAG: multidrug ABC transporter permease [Robiginitomaculum sp.]
MSSELHNFKVRHIGIINWLGLWTLFTKEVMRFIKVGFQTLLAPVISSLMFLVIFKYAFGDARPAIHGVEYVQFLIPGLMMMGMLNQSFANTASSLIISKVQGNSVDFLMPPLSALELCLAFIGGAATRGLMVGIGTGLAMMLMMPFDIAHPWAVLVFGLNAVLMMGMIGLIAGITGNRFDHLAAIQNFFLLPLTMLSGTFYSITVLPESFQRLSMINPFFYLIDGFRYGFTGVSDGNVGTGVLFVSVINIILASTCYLILRSGWRLKT